MEFRFRAIEYERHCFYLSYYCAIGDIPPCCDAGMDRECLEIYTIRSGYLTYSAYAICGMAQVMRKQKGRRFIFKGAGFDKFLKILGN
jgi:hypothetical protein